MSARFPRRRFLHVSAAAGAGIVILRDSRSARGYSANAKLQIAAVGVCGQGESNLSQLTGEDVVALCDVDQRRADAVCGRFPKAARYTDFRKLLDREHRRIDAVVVSTPDHTHAVAAVAAMKLGKHVFCEKPLTRTVHEARLMRQTAIAKKVVTQMGNQGSATEDLRRMVELAHSGVMGELREAHVWLAGGDGSADRPKDTPPIPPGLEWDLWLGPAPARTYHPSYTPGAWRRWRAFGSGGGGDMGCHTTNMAFRALRLDLLWNADVATSPAAPHAPRLIRVSSHASEIHPETYPRRITATFEFPSRGNLPPAKLHWYNGGPKPPKDVLLGHAMTEWGCLVLGSQGALFTSCPWNTRMELLPKAKFQGFQGPAPTLARSPGHHAEWVRGCKGGPRPFSGFEIGGPMTEMIQLVHVASLTGNTLDYDPVSGTIVNAPDANALLHRPYRAGWTL